MTNRSIDPQFVMKKVSLSNVVSGEYNSRNVGVGSSQSIKLANKFRRDNNVLSLVPKALTRDTSVTNGIIKEESPRYSAP